MNAEWSWQAAAISAPFAQAGRLGVDHDQPSQATKLYAHRLDSTNVDRTGNLMRLSRHDVIYLQAKNDAASWHRYKVTGQAQRQGDCWVVPVITHVGSAAGSEPAQAAPLLVTIPGDI